MNAINPSEEASYDQCTNLLLSVLPTADVLQWGSDGSKESVRGEVRSAVSLRAPLMNILVF